jgi:hypothetical protein
MSDDFARVILLLFMGSVIGYILLGVWRFFTEREGKLKLLDWMVFFGIVLGFLITWGLGFRDEYGGPFGWIAFGVFGLLSIGLLLGGLIEGMRKLMKKVERGKLKIEIDIKKMILTVTFVITFTICWIFWSILQKYNDYMQIIICGLLFGGIYCLISLLVRFTSVRNENERIGKRNCD